MNGIYEDVENSRSSSLGAGVGEKSRDYFGDSKYEMPDEPQWRCQVESSTWNINLYSGQQFKGCKHLSFTA